MLDGRVTRLTGITEASEHVVSGRAWLERDQRSLAVPLEGCARDAEHAYRVERAVAGRGSWARFARLRAGDPLAPEYGQEVAVGVLHEVRTTDGWTITIGSIDVRTDGSWIVVLDARQGDSREEPSVYLPNGAEGSSTQTFGQHRLVTLRASGQRDALGCPTFAATFENPEEQIIDVALGEAVWLRARARARAGHLTVRFIGLGERITVAGPHQPIVSLEASDGERSESLIAGVPGAVEWNGHAVEVLAVDRGRARLRVRRAE